jgi:hypothetical protein
MFTLYYYALAIKKIKNEAAAGRRSRQGSSAKPQRGGGEVERRIVRRYILTPHKYLPTTEVCTFVP